MRRLADDRVSAVAKAKILTRVCLGDLFPQYLSLLGEIL